MREAKGTASGRRSKRQAAPFSAGFICVRPWTIVSRARRGIAPGTWTWAIRLRKAVWGKGYATEAARALVHKAFAELGATCVVAVALADNVASTRVMEKAGLKWVSTFALPGYGRPAVKYALDQEQRGAAPRISPGE